ncbi:hypothetical protein ACIGO6_37880 [Streptomyces sp. NPDC053750]|uniref:hypothetical protein n=1 Tax=Streptomyces sp. NPDC053750 TaxID=3365714 RepID=UPI0037D5C9CF
MAAVPPPRSPERRLLGGFAKPSGRASPLPPATVGHGPSTRSTCSISQSENASALLPVPLAELIDEFEFAAGMQPAGDAYGGLIPEFFRFGPMQDHFFDRHRYDDALRALIAVIGSDADDTGS